MNTTTLSPTAVEECPGCGSVEVRAVEARWFGIDLDRDAELRTSILQAGEDRVLVDFTCRDCGHDWD